MKYARLKFGSSIPLPFQYDDLWILVHRRLGFLINVRFDLQDRWRR